MSKLEKCVNIKKILKKESPDEIDNIVDFFLNCCKQQKLPSDLARIACVTKVSYHSNLKILAPKEMLLRLPIALAQVKAGNTSENLLNKIRQFICSLCGAKEIIKKLYINIMNSIKL